MVDTIAANGSSTAHPICVKSMGERHRRMRSRKPIENKPKSLNECIARADMKPFVYRKCKKRKGSSCRASDLISARNTRRQNDGNGLNRDRKSELTNLIFGQGQRTRLMYVRMNRPSCWIERSCKKGEQIGGQVQEHIARVLMSCDSLLAFAKPCRCRLQLKSRGRRTFILLFTQFI